MASEVLVVYCTFPDADVAGRIGGALVGEGLAACVNIVTEVRSLYMWKGALCDDAEVLALIKTTAARFEALRSRIAELHPYECPEIIAVPVDRGQADYLAWVRESTSAGRL